MLTSQNEPIVCECDRCGESADLTSIERWTHRRKGPMRVYVFYCTHCDNSMILTPKELYGENDENQDH